MKITVRVRVPGNGELIQEVVDAPTFEEAEQIAAERARQRANGEPIQLPAVVEPVEEIGRRGVAEATRRLQLTQPFSVRKEDAA